MINGNIINKKCDNCGIEYNKGPYCPKCGPLVGEMQINGPSICKPLVMQFDGQLDLLVEQINKPSIRLSATQTSIEII